tara:strand:+ start:264 stop:1130 length:867 start_codon:yes stop_codon:yes gene_type:complete
MKLFVTGANGYIGRNFINKASIKGFKIFALTRKKKNRKIKNVTWLVGPIDKFWKELNKDVILVHLAAAGAKREKGQNLKKFKNFNVTKSKRLLKNAVKSNCNKWIIISTNKEKRIEKARITNSIIKKNKYDHDFNYALSKYLFTQECLKIAKENRIKCRILRLFHIYGRDENKSRLWPLLINAAKKNINFKMSSGDQLTDFNHIDDVVDGILDATNFDKKNKKKYPQLWDMASGRSMTVKKFANAIWTKFKPKSKILFDKLEVYDQTNYKVQKNFHWKIKFTKPERAK